MLTVRFARIALSVALAVLPVSARALPVTATHWTNVRHLIGFGTAAKNVTGNLWVTPEGLGFTTSGLQTFLDWRQIRKVEGNRERVETGGTAGKVVRFALPYGGGSLVGTFTQKSVGILTIEFADPTGGVHNAVFIMPVGEGLEAETEISARLNESAALPDESSCPASTSEAVRISLDLSSLDAREYEALLYEHLVDNLVRDLPSIVVLRGESDRPHCAADQLILTIQHVSKGNAVVRTVTGPAGLFIDVTHIRVHVVLKGAHVASSIDRDFAASRRGDRESLTAASALATQIGKRVERSIPVTTEQQ